MFDDLFSRLPPSSRSVWRGAAGDVLFRQGAPARGLFHIRRGSVVMQRVTRDGARVILHRAGAGTLLAEASIFSDIYHCDALCRAETETCRYDKTAIRNALRTDPVFALQFAEALSHQVQQTRQVIELMAIRPARDRVLAALRLGLLGGSVTDFAARIGLTREACYRALRVLVTEGRVAQTGRGRYVLA